MIQVFSDAQALLGKYLEASAVDGMLADIIASLKKIVDFNGIEQFIIAPSTLIDGTLSSQVVNTT